MDTGLFDKIDRTPAKQSGYLDENGYSDDGKLFDGDL